MCSFENTPVISLLFSYLGTFQIQTCRESVVDIERAICFKAFVNTFSFDKYLPR
jgi:hypothetical protein